MVSISLPTRDWFLQLYGHDHKMRKETLQSVMSDFKKAIGRKTSEAARRKEATHQIKAQINKIKDKFQEQEDACKLKCTEWLNKFKKQLPPGDPNLEPLQATVALGISKIFVLHKVLSDWSRIDLIKQFYLCAFTEMDDLEFQNTVEPERSTTHENGWRELGNALKSSNIRSLYDKYLEAFKLPKTNCYNWIIVGELQNGSYPNFTYPQCFHILTNQPNDSSFIPRNQSSQHYSLEMHSFLLCRPKRHYWSSAGTNTLNSVSKEQGLVLGKESFAVEVQKAYDENKILQEHVDAWMNGCRNKTWEDTIDFQKQSGLVSLPVFSNFQKFSTRSDMQGSFKEMLEDLLPCFECILMSEMEQRSSEDKDTLESRVTFTISNEVTMDALAGGGSRSRADTGISVRRSYLDSKGKRVWVYGKVALFEDKWKKHLDKIFVRIPGDGDSKGECVRDPKERIEIHIKGVDSGSLSSEDKLWHQIYNTASRSVVAIATDGCRYILVYRVKHLVLHCSRIFQLFGKPQVVGADHQLHGQEDIISKEAEEILSRTYLRDRVIFCSVLLQAMRYSLHHSYTMSRDRKPEHKFQEFKILKKYKNLYEKPPLIG